jgi:dolichol-phosphate mannosyltransferase
MNPAKPSTMTDKPSSSNRPDSAEHVGSSQKLALVVPTLCEAGNIRALLERIRGALDPLGMPYELIVVDDDSGDGIDEIVGQIASKDPRVRLLVRKGVRGLAGAVIHGWRNTDAGILGVMDADLQHPPELLPQLWQALQSGADVVVASRSAPRGSRGNWNRFRHLLSQVAIWMTWPLQKPGIRVQDPMSGFFLARRSCIKDITLQPQGFKILLEILVRGNLDSAKEIPFIFGQRYAGRSKASLKVGLDYLILLGKLWRNRRLKSIASS